MIEAVAENQPQANGTTPDAYIDSSFVKLLDESGFYKQLGIS